VLRIVLDFASLCLRETLLRKGKQQSCHDYVRAQILHLFVLP
jgi:hypothetical protein